MWMVFWRIFFLFALGFPLLQAIKMGNTTAIWFWSFPLIFAGLIALFFLVVHVLSLIHYRRNTGRWRDRGEG